MPSFRFHRPIIRPADLLSRKYLRPFHFRTQPLGVACYSAAAAAASQPVPEEYVDSSQVHRLPLLKPGFIQYPRVEKPAPLLYPRVEKLAPVQAKPVAKPCSTKYDQGNKNSIKRLFEARAPHLDYRPYLAASHVFQMRLDNYVIDNLIDW